jgi:hypothetical protein
MRIHGLMVIRDEDDIIAQSLPHLLDWIDSVYVLDMGSTDATWEIVNEIASKDRRVVPFKSCAYRFDDSVRGFIFETFRSRFRNGDWIVRTDADEIYHVDPRDFLKERVQTHESCVYLAWYYFRLTTKEVEDYESGKTILAEDRSRPVTERRRYYKIPDYSEPRMFRYRHSMKWPASRTIPFNAGCPAKERILIRHYPHRDPEQMRKRYRLRAEMMRLNAGAGPHWKLEEWQKDVIEIDSHSGATRERTQAAEGLAAADGHTAGPLYFWQPGTALPPITGKQHLPHWSKQAVQRFLLPGLVQVIDPFRPPWPPGSEPALLPKEHRKIAVHEA